MRHLSALSLLVPLVVLGAASTAQAAPACHGHAPTHVGTSGGTVTGTGSDDVIVTEGAIEVQASGGDDLICVTGSTPDPSDFVRISTGDGDDRVDSSVGKHQLRAELGKGVDAFVGGPGGEAVVTGDASDGGESVSTGDGPDYVETGATGKPMDNTISTGAGKDEIHFRGLPGTGSIDAGTERDTVYLRDKTRAAWAVDNRRSRISAKGAAMPFVSAEDFKTYSLTWRSLRFTGSSSPETLDLTDFGSNRGNGPVQVELGDGQDVMWVDRATRGSLDGGGQADTLVVDAFGSRGTQGAARVDLRSGRTNLAGHQLGTTSFTDLSLMGFARNTVRGTAAGNRLWVQGCRATIHAGGGADTIQLGRVTSGCPGPVPTHSLTAYGEAGPDYLRGATGDDALIGGPGRDTAHGGPGRNVCSAEVEIRC